LESADIELVQTMLFESKKHRAPQKSISEGVFLSVLGTKIHCCDPSTIPPELCSTSCRPDLVVWSLDTDEIRILELTVCHNSISSIESARKRKQKIQPYSELTSDLEMTGHSVLRYHRDWLSRPLLEI